MKASEAERVAAETLSAARDGLNTRFSDMHKAFQSVDLDRSGTLDRSEIERALNMWGVPMSPAKLDQLWEQLDTNAK